MRITGKFFRIGLVCCQVVVGMPTVYAGIGVVQHADAKQGLVLVLQEMITSGANLKKYIWNFNRNKKAVKVDVNVIEVDLTNPNVKLDTMTGKDGQYTKKQAVFGMVKETGAVAGINGSFYNMKAEGVPQGPEINRGKLILTPPKIPGLYSFALIEGNIPIVDTFMFEGQIIAKDGTFYGLDGINETYYWHDDGMHSHMDGLFMYTHIFGNSYRSNDGKSTPTEVLVEDDIITEIVINGVIKKMAPKNGYILRASGRAVEYVRDHLVVGDSITVQYDMSALGSQQKCDLEKFKMMIGGHSILVDEGQVASFSRDMAGLKGHRSRTAIGYSQDLKTAYLITADNFKNSKGLSLSELQQFMIQVGVWKGLLLDGGGSTQMVARPLGEMVGKLVNKTEDSYEREVVNGVGVFSLAPKGQLKGLILNGKKQLFIGEKATFALSAYDEYYNPIGIERKDLEWKSDGEIGHFKENVFIAEQAGTGEIKVTSETMSNSADVQVVGRSDIQNLKIETRDITLVENTTYKLPVYATTKDGNRREIPQQLVKWKVLGIEGEVKDGVLTVGKLENSKAAQLIASYDGYSTMLTMPIGEEKAGQMPQLSRSNIGLTVGKKKVTVAGKAYKLEQVPIIMDGTTLIPFRFVTEALGDKVEWDHDARKVRVTRGGTLIEFWIGDTSLNVNGERTTAKVAPQIMNGVTMVPLRLISEKFGFKVGWEPARQAIYIR